MSRLLTPALLCGLLALGRDAQAEDPYAWTEPPPEQQLAQDHTEIPIGKGAIFVPSITGPEYEPPATVVTADEVLSVPLGQRYLLDPGPYVVVMSAGSPAQGVGIAVDVVEGETTLVPVEWGALRIEVTDEHRIPYRGAYEIIRGDTREPVGTGFGADTLQGEILQTWLLAPGLYRIVLPGKDFRALRDYATVVVPEGGFVRYRLVQDPDTQAFQGSGVLLPDEFSTAGQTNQRWFNALVLGVDGSMVNNQNVVGAFNQTQYNASGYVDAQFSFTARPSQVTGLFQLEEGVSQIIPQEGDPLPLVKATDRLRGDLLYTYDYKGSSGPYVRMSADSQAFPTDVLLTEDTTVSVLNEDGERERTDVAANETFRLADAGFPTLLREGVGINTSFLQKNRSTAFNLRVGYGMRQNYYGGALVLDDRAGTEAVEYTSIESFNQKGIEATVVASVRLPGWVVYSTDIEMFADFASFGDKWEHTATWELPYPPWSVAWRNTLSLRLTRNVSFNYFLNINIEPLVIDKPQVEQSLLLRASWALF